MARLCKYPCFLILMLTATSFPKSYLYSMDDEISLYRNTLQIIRQRPLNAESAIEKFAKKYPNSPGTASLYFLYADAPVPVSEAIRRHSKVISLGDKRFTELSLLRKCQIYYLQSSWDDLERSAVQGMRLGGHEENNFIGFLITAMVEKGDYTAASNLSRRLLNNDYRYETQALTLLAEAFIKRIQTGYSRDYMLSLRETAIGFGESEIFPTTLFLLGDFHEKTGAPDRAYSAYADLVNYFPGSPEAEFARVRLNALKGQPLTRKGYIPREDQIESGSPIDISPDSPVDEAEGDIYYSLSIGPFDSARESNRISGLLKDYSVNRIKTKSGYSIFAGRFRSKEDAYRLRIRIAEEFGINGHIVMVSEKDGKIFVYGE